MVCIDLSERRQAVRTAFRSALEGALLASAAWVAAALIAGRAVSAQVARGLFAAWAASTASVAALLFARLVSQRAFWRAFGGGMALRLGVLAALIKAYWGATPAAMAALLVSYALGVFSLLLLEYKNITGISI